MPTIDLSNNQQTTNTPVSTNPAPVNQPQPAAPAIPAPPPNNGWNDPWGSPWGGDNSGGGKRLSPQERVTMIEAVFNEILGRKPDTRDINYYKYSTLSEEEIRKQLITGNEHKQLLADGRDYKKVKDRALQAETRSKVLEGQIKDQVEEFKQLTDLLKEKNRYIQELREKLNKDHNLHPFKNNEEGAVQHIHVNNNTHFVSTTAQPVQPSNEPSNSKPKGDFIDRLKDSISNLF